MLRPKPPADRFKPVEHGDRLRKSWAKTQEHNKVVYLESRGQPPILGEDLERLDLFAVSKELLAVLESELGGKKPADIEPPPGGSDRPKGPWHVLL